MKGNKYLLSIVETSRQYNLPRTRLYHAARNNELPIFVKVGEFTKVNTTLLEKLLDEAAITGKPLF